MEMMGKYRSCMPVLGMWQDRVQMNELVTFLCTVGHCNVAFILLGIL